MIVGPVGRCREVAPRSKTSMIIMRPEMTIGLQASQFRVSRCSTSDVSRGCVETRSNRRCTELFSQLPFSDRSCQVSASTKLRRKIQTKVEVGVLTQRATSELMQRSIIRLDRRRGQQGLEGWRGRAGVAARRHNRHVGHPGPKPVAQSGFRVQDFRPRRRLSGVQKQVRMWHDKVESIGDLWRGGRTRLCRKR